MKRFLLIFILSLSVCGGIFAGEKVSKNEITGHSSAGTSIERGIVRLEGLGENGSIVYYILTARGGFVPVNDTSNFADSTYISLYIDGAEYRLNKSKKVSFEYSAENDVLVERWTIKNKVEFTVTHMIDRNDSVLIQYQLNNISGKKHDYAIKSVYNTKLGENRRSHFSTARKSDIYNEEILVPSKDDSWIISGDGKYAVEFDIFGKDITPPQKAVMANSDIIKGAVPQTEFKAGRAFDSLLSYNDSSVALFWTGIQLEDDASERFTHRLSFSTNDFQNAGKRSGAEEREDEVKPAEKEPEAADGQEAVLEPEQKEDEALEEEPVKEEDPSENLDYGFNTEASGPDSSKLNAEYVQQLINYINSLEQSDPSLNRMKIQQLQTEVDEVLQILRGRK